MKRTAKAVWKGTGTKGTGALTTQSGVLSEQPYSLKKRFENEEGKEGTNPDELIAAAHAGCFTMALSLALEKAGYSAENLETDASLSLDKMENGWKISKIDLSLKASVPDIGEDEFGKIANEAKEGCPVSQVLNCEITLDYSLN